ncbi:TetR/AcrR family transcriptional regulator [Novosphingobium colocasiae]
MREAVLQAALDCYGVFGYDGTSTRAVADRANVTHTLVLYHFRSKEDLWIAALDKALASYEEAISPILDGNEGMCPGIRLRHFIEQFVRFFRALSANPPDHDDGGQPGHPASGMGDR